jgi:nucleotide-binding universal stress UspA family protein
MRTVLVAIDDARQGEEAVRLLLEDPREAPVGHIHLLNVQPMLDGYVRRFVDAGTIRRFEREEGEKALAGARLVLEEAGIASTAHIRIGEASRTIADAADELGTDEIVVGADGLDVLGRAMLHILVIRLTRASRVPVRIVTSRRRRRVGTARPAPGLRPA